MASEPFFKVCHVRFDGGAHDLTLIGYASEGTALNLARELNESRHVLYVVVLQRYSENDSVVGWHRVVEYWKPRGTEDV